MARSSGRLVGPFGAYTLVIVSQLRQAMVRD